MESDKYSPFDVQSTVRRIKNRMLEADKELGAARAVYWHRRGKWLRERSLYLLGNQCEENPHDLDMIILWQRQALRVLEERPVPHWESMWPGLGHTMYDMAVSDCGMAVVWGLMHADKLEPEDPEEIVTEWEQQRRVKANSKRPMPRTRSTSATGSTIIRKLQWEEEGKSVRRDRGLVFSVVSGVDARAIWREFGECNCPRPGMCDLCALPGLR